MWTQKRNQLPSSPSSSFSPAVLRVHITCVSRRAIQRDSCSARPSMVKLQTGGARKLKLSEAAGDLPCRMPIFHVRDDDGAWTQPMFLSCFDSASSDVASSPTLRCTRCVSVSPHCARVFREPLLFHLCNRLFFLCLGLYRVPGTVRRPRGILPLCRHASRSHPLLQVIRLKGTRVDRKKKEGNDRANLLRLRSGYSVGKKKKKKRQETRVVIHSSGFTCPFIIDIGSDHGYSPSPPHLPSRHTARSAEPPACRILPPSAQSHLVPGPPPPSSY